jgi:hypothetical protein
MRRSRVGRGGKVHPTILPRIGPVGRLAAVGSDDAPELA